MAGGAFVAALSTALRNERRATPARIGRAVAAPLPEKGLRPRCPADAVCVSTHAVHDSTLAAHTHAQQTAASRMLLPPTQALTRTDRTTSHGSREHGSTAYHVTTYVWQPSPEAWRRLLLFCFTRPVCLEPFI
jgi:hypothetical protein